MEEKRIRELSMDEMEKVSGGGTDATDTIAYWAKGHPCPNCGESRLNWLQLVSHTTCAAIIQCYSCGKMYEVSK